jgi:hypothetical protein
MADLPGPLAYLEFLQPDRDGQVRVLLTCSCGRATDLTAEIGGCPVYVCAGCGTDYRLEVRATGVTATATGDGDD